MSLNTESIFDPTLPHNFIECTSRGTVGSTCPSTEHCLCGNPYNHEIHRHEQDAGGQL